MSSSSPEESVEEGNFVTGRINTAQLFQAMSNLARTRKRGHEASAGGCEGSKRPRGARDLTYEFVCDTCERLFVTETAMRYHNCAPASCDLCNKQLRDIYNHYVKVHHILYPEQLMFGTGNALVHSAVDTRGGKALWFLKAKCEAIEKYDDLTCRLCERKNRDVNSSGLRLHYMWYHMIEPDMLCKVKKLFRAGKGAHLGESSAAGPRRERDGAASASAPAALFHSKHEEPNIRCVIEKYDDLTCRLCDSENKFPNSLKLGDHYVLQHKVNPAVLDKLKELFRAGKGETEGKSELVNAPSESALIKNSNNDIELITVLQDNVVSVFCEQCNTSVTYTDFEAHAATHNKNNYVAENRQDNGQTQLGSPGRGHEKSKEKATEGNRDGTAEPWLSDDDTCDNLRNSSYVLEVDVHAERGENIRRETTGQSDSGHNSKDNGHEMAADIETTVNAVSTPEDQTAGSSSAGTRHVQDIEGQEEEWDGMGNELMGDLKNLLGPAGTGADADKSSSDTRSTSHLIEETQRIKDIMFSRD